jgi:hypothetical protein
MIQLSTNYSLTATFAMTRLFIYSTAKQQQETRQEPFGSSGEKAAAVMLW